MKEDVDIIVEITAAYYRIPASELYGRSRKYRIATARHVAMYVCRRCIRWITLKEIGACFGGRDHTTVINALDRVQGLMDTDQDVRSDVEGVWVVAYARTRPRLAEQQRRAA